MDSSGVTLLVTAASVLCGLALAWAIFWWMLSPLALAPGVGPASALRFAEGERDRMQTVAKGVAASSGGFLVAVLTALIEDKVADEISWYSMVFVLLGSIGMLLIAAAYYQASAEYWASAVGSHPQVQDGDGAA